MKKYFSFSVLLALCLSLSYSCRPDEALDLTNSLDFSLNSDIFNYKVYLKVVDENGDPITDGELIVLGPDADKIYNEFGTRDFEVNANGELTLTVHPSFEPMPNKPLNINIFVKADGFEKGAKSIVINEGQFATQDRVGIWSLAGLKEKMGMEIYPLTASNGKITSGSILNKKDGQLRIINKVNLDSVYYDEKDAAIIIESGSSFFYYHSVTHQVPVYSKTVKELYDTITINGTMIPVKVGQDVVVDTTYETRVLRYERRPYTGSEIQLRTFVWLANQGNNFKYQTGVPASRDYQLQTLTDGTGPNARATLNHVTKAEGVGASFHGELEDGSPVQIYPDYTAGATVLYSYVIEPGKINKETGVAFVAGDSVETGKNYRRVDGTYILTTRKAAVKVAGNGQLRVQGPDYSYGFYEFLPFEYDININLNPNLPDTSVIPDRENLIYDLDARFTVGGSGYFNIYWDYQRQASSLYNEMAIERSVYTNQQLGPASVEIKRYYWGTKWFDEATTTGNSQNLNIFPTAWKNANVFADRTHYKVSVVCEANNNTRLYPSATASSTIDGFPVFLYMTNGSWSTRGIALGDTMSFDIKYKEWSLDTAFAVKQAKNIIEYKADKNLDICNF